MILSSRELMPVIRAALERGQHVRMTVNGSSMLPFLYDNDVIELESVLAPRLGDMVLVQIDTYSETERYVLHRIVHMIEGGTFFIRGDSQRHCEGPFAREAVIGRVATVWRNERACALNRCPWRLVGLMWVWTCPLGFFLLELMLFLRKKG